MVDEVTTEQHFSLRGIDPVKVRRHVAEEVLRAANAATGQVQPTHGVISRDEVYGTPEWRARYDATHFPTKASEAPNDSRLADESSE